MNLEGCYLPSENKNGTSGRLKKKKNKVVGKVQMRK